MLAQELEGNVGFQKRRQSAMKTGERKEGDQAEHSSTCGLAKASQTPSRVYTATAPLKMARNWVWCQGAGLRKRQSAAFKKLICVFPMYSWDLPPNGTLSSCFIFNLWKPYSPLTTSHCMWLSFPPFLGRKKKSPHLPDCLPKPQPGEPATPSLEKALTSDHCPYARHTRPCPVPSIPTDGFGPTSQR